MPTALENFNLSSFLVFIISDVPISLFEKWFQDIFIFSKPICHVFSVQGLRLTQQLLALLSSRKTTSPQLSDLLSITPLLDLLEQRSHRIKCQVSESMKPIWNSLNSQVLKGMRICIKLERRMLKFETREINLY